MPSVTIRTRLIGKIKSMKDESLLVEIEDIIDHLSEMNQIYPLSDEMKSSIKKSENDIKEDKVFSDEAAGLHFKEWFERR
ncbi:MAG: hypothetical protein WAT79_15920 [Saprospiraceae bacterium]